MLYLPVLEKLLVMFPLEDHDFEACIRAFPAPIKGLDGVSSTVLGIN